MKKNKGMTFLKEPPKQDGVYVAMDVDCNYDIFRIEDGYVQGGNGSWGTDLKDILEDGWMFGDLIEPL